MLMKNVQNVENHGPEFNGMEHCLDGTDKSMPNILVANNRAMKITAKMAIAIVKCF